MTPRAITGSPRRMLAMILSRYKLSPSGVFCLGTISKLRPAAAKPLRYGAAGSSDIRSSAQLSSCQPGPQFSRNAAPLAPINIT